MMNLLKTPILCLLLVTVAGCTYLKLDEVLPDKRTEYRNSRGLEALEVPPDLTSDTINDSMEIPGEDTPNTLSAYEKQQRDAAGGTALSGALADEDSVTLSGDRFAIWPKLKEFWQERGYSLELDDAELGVLETTWSEPRDTADGQARDRFKVFAEPGNQEDTTLLFVSHDQQRRDSAAGEWLDAGSEAERRKAMTAALYEFFGGPETGGRQVAASDGGGSGGSESTATAEPRSGLPRAEIINTDDGQMYMSLPEGPDTAWSATEKAITGAGMEIRSADEDKGEFVVAYMPPEAQDDGGWFEALKFWKDDGPVVYRLRLAPADDKTEVTVRDEDGEWQSTDEAREMLNQIQRRYNR